MTSQDKKDFSIGIFVIVYVTLLMGVLIICDLLIWKSHALAFATFMVALVSLTILSGVMIERWKELKGKS